MFIDFGAAYPELKDMEIVFQPMERGVHGMFDGERIILSDDFTTTRQQRNADQIAEIEKTPEYQKYQQELEATDNIDDPIKAEQEFDRIDAEWQSTELGARYTELLNTNRLEVVSTGKVREDMLPSLIHEIQHAIQEKEGFARGGSNTGTGYHNLAGEVEARNVQRRADMTLEERRASLARETEDVAREDQIIIEDGLNKEMMAGEQRQEITPEAEHAAWEQVQKDSEEWGRQLDEFDSAPSRGADKRRLLSVCHTPDVLRKLGASSLPMTMTAGNLEKILSNKIDHGLTKDLLVQLPTALADPIMVFESATEPEAIVMLTGLKHEGRSIMVAVHLNRENQRIRVNDIASAYKRSSESWYISQIQEGRLLYQDKKKSLAWARTKGLQLPKVRRLPSRLSNNRLLTGTDIVKPVKHPELIPSDENKTLYQTGQGAEVGRFYQDSPQGGHRASVTFGVDDLFALIKISKNADASSVMHELFHVHRRMWEEMYNDPSVSPAVKERYRRACEFVGAEPGKEWTVAQEEKFARAGERYLLEGESPHPSMDGVMENFKQWLYAIYSDADRAGLEISDSMRNVFAGMLGTAELGDLNFRYSMGRMLQYEPEDGIDTNVDMPPAGRPSNRTGTNTVTNTGTNAADGAANGTTDKAAVQALEDYAADATARADEAFEALADNPAAQETIRAEYETEMAAADTVIADAQREIEISRAAAECVMRG